MAIRMVVKAGTKVRLIGKTAGNANMLVATLAMIEARVLTGDFLDVIVDHTELKRQLGVKPVEMITDEAALMQAVNTSIWLPIMAWRDWLQEQGAEDDLIFGLNWLIDNHKYPETTTVPNPRRIAYIWRAVESVNSYVPQALPAAIRDSIEAVYPPEGYPYYPLIRHTPFPTVQQAFWTAAVAIGRKRDKLYEKKDDNSEPEEENDS